MIKLDFEQQVLAALGRIEANQEEMRAHLSNHDAYMRQAFEHISSFFVYREIVEKHDAEIRNIKKVLAMQD